jgi:hypothetical protein
LIDPEDAMAGRTMNTAILLAVLGFAFTTVPSIAQAPWQLITPEEDAGDRAAPDVPAPPDLPSPPTIDLLRPDISRPVQNPVSMELRFSAGPDSAINMQSFNATYGRLGINITRRLLEHAVVTANGISAENVDLPPGSHRVTLSIADTSGKRASRTFQFTVSR